MEVRKPGEGLAWVGVAIAAVFIAVLSARPYAGSWNDGSRLATVESLVDRGTLIIDDSIFVKVPVLPSPSPYPPEDELLNSRGTLDKLFINGHFYSDKSPAPAFYMAAVYQMWRWLGGPAAAERPDWFCLLLTLTTSGLAYVTAVLCVLAIGAQLDLSVGTRLLITAFFGLGTIALPYAQHVNNHMLLLAVAGLLFLQLLKCNREGWTAWRPIRIGVLLGVAYTIDLAAGPMLVLAIVGLLLSAAATRWRIAIVFLAALPWFVFHHAVNYSVGGTFGPANAVPRYLDWPGSPFNASNMTGTWAHTSLLKTVLYALDMEFGKKGFLSHNLLVFLSLVMFPRLIRSDYPERRIVVASQVWSFGTWLLYAVTSTNLSGGCCSIRWFVPLLVPAFLALGIIWRDYPSKRIDALILGTGGVFLGACMALQGPWCMRVIPGFWLLYATTVGVWGARSLWKWKRAKLRELPVVLIDNRVIVKTGEPSISGAELASRAA